MNLYLVMTVLFVGMALLGAVDSTLTSFSILPWFNGLRWLRVHLITLGILTESLFGLVPVIVAFKNGHRRPKTRFEIWLTLNAGILTLLIGIPLINQAIIVVGGTLIFIATLLLIHQIWQLRLPSKAPKPANMTGKWFYIIGLAYLLLGIFVGMGFWFGWNQTLGMAVPIEVHIHANNWGFLSLVFTGLLIDFFPRATGLSWEWENSTNKIFWLMTLGALGLVLGPWTTWKAFTVPGLLMHLTGTVWLLLNILLPAIRAQQHRTIGFLHLVTAYVWFLAPVLIAPLILLEVPGFPGVGIEQNAPQALIYGWVLQFSYAILPYAFARLLLRQQNTPLGGSWLSLITVHIGGVCLWASIFILNYQNFLHGMAYLFWTISMLPIAWQLWRIVQKSWSQWESQQGIFSESSA